jgi:uncharacterized membrane protein YoaK (UPF0700 family)
VTPERQLWAAVPLVGLAGSVDAIGWLRLEEMFVGIITGNSTLLGVALARGNAPRALALAGLVGLFALGALLGALLGRLAGRWRIPAVLGTVAGLLLLAAALPFTMGPGLPPAALALVPAMGMVNTALPAAGGISFLTGTLVRAMQGVVAALAGETPRWAWLPHLAAWAALLAGAVLGAMLELALGGRALLVPGLAMAMAALWAAQGTARAR